MQRFNEAWAGLRHRFEPYRAYVDPTAAQYAAGNTNDDHDHREQSEGDAALPDDDACCRICFGGFDPDLGRLFSPCLCRGTARYVHTACLESWRKAAHNARSFYQCDQCGYKYKIGRTKIAGLATNPLALYTLTAILFLTLTFVAGFLASTILYFTDLLPSSPWFEDLTWYMGMSNPMAHFWDYGDAIGGMTEKSFDVFAGSPRAGGRGSVQRLLYNSGLTNPAYKNTWTVKMLSHFALGFSTIGILSFLQMAISYSLLAPLHHLRVFRRGGGNQRANERNTGTDLGAILVIFFVLVGTAKAIFSLYKLVKRLSRVFLTRVEAGVLEVG